jgi:excisionase family DNA binding protein
MSCDRKDAPVTAIDDLPRLLLTAEEAAHLLHISRSKVYELMASGELQSVPIGRSRRIPYDAVTAYISRLIEES